MALGHGGEEEMRRDEEGFFLVMHCAVRRGCDVIEGVGGERVTKEMTVTSE